MQKKVVNYIFCLLLLGCTNQNRQKELDLGNIVAKGEIKDSIYNGVIKFYDKSTEKLVKECNYENGVLSGEYKQYYLNGNIMMDGNYSDGKPNGYSYNYDSSGILISKAYIYYGLRVGPNIDYIYKNPSKYFFYSLENNLLFNINYDSIGEKGILEIAENFFFINTYLVDDSTVEYKIYNINPPRYNFKYSLVIADESQKIKTTLKEFISDEIWHTFKIHRNSIVSKNEWYAIKIDIKDSINNRDCVMQKFLQEQ